MALFPVLILALAVRFAISALSVYFEYPDSFATPSVALAQVTCLALVVFFGSPSKSGWTLFTIWTFCGVFFCGVVLKLAEGGVGLLNSVTIVGTELALPIVSIAVMSLLRSRRTPAQSTPATPAETVLDD